MPGNNLICSLWAGGVTLSRCFQESGKDGWYFQVTRARRAVVNLCSGLAYRSGCEVKELTPLAEGPTSGNPKPSVHCQQYETAVNTVRAHDPVGSGCASPQLSRGLPWSTFPWLNRTWPDVTQAGQVVWGCQKGQQHMIHGVGGSEQAAQVTPTFCCRGK